MRALRDSCVGVACDMLPLRASYWRCVWTYAGNPRDSPGAVFDHAQRACLTIPGKPCLDFDPEVLADDTHPTVLSTYLTSSSLKLISGFTPCVAKLLSCDVTELERAAGSVFAILQQDAELLSPYAETIVNVFLNKESVRPSLGMTLRGLLQHNPEGFLLHLDGIIESMEDMTLCDKATLYVLFDDVAKKNPEALEAHIDVVLKDISDAALSFMSFMVVSELSLHYPKRFENHLYRCIKIWEQNPNVTAFASKIVASVGRISKKHADMSLKILFGKLGTIDPMFTSVVLMEAKRVAQAYKESMEPYRPLIEKLKTSQQMDVPEVAQSILDFLDDKSLQSIGENLEGQREDIDTLDGDEIRDVKSDVHDQGEKLEELKVVVDDTVKKVDEIDHKTITDVPKWFRDVSKLLNPKHEHDWRFLAIRLGYSGEDIRNLALSTDPTMDILTERYSTHKSSDATFAILSALKDIGRSDAVEIITQSLEEAEKMVLQAQPDDSGKTPVIFLSYQWDHQPEVTAIKNHLEMAGFPCWMDIHQMGGGDQLHDRINQGMRSAKVVLCMVTEKYSGSENCKREATLASNLNKPIIPILIDRTPWPPEGALAMFFAQLLHIQFYNEKEYVRGEKFWDDSKFFELLGQISYHANPDESMVTDEYRNWVPKLDDRPVVMKKVEETKSPDRPSTSATESEEHPSVFISYQWDKQPEVKRLFSRLTSLGYHCWLDINQMGGVDPLYSKIEEGIRNAKVVLSCVTPKYALSANCRREVSLSDTLRKPIVPLLMEQMPWPPEGPMRMPFTQLVNIDFTKEASQAKFDDEKFDELVLKIQEKAQPTLETKTGVDTLEPQEVQDSRSTDNSNSPREDYTGCDRLSSICLII
ncbi:uncharacterized protein [Diadema setosum]|uniref:uncharacterized protein n=1 Tax=Diadema setosum TaxID=31175 RepID=UPI003B3BE8BA